MQTVWLEQLSMLSFLPCAAYSIGFSGPSLHDLYPLLFSFYFRYLSIYVMYNCLITFTYIFQSLFILLFYIIFSFYTTVIIYDFF